MSQPTVIAWQNSQELVDETLFTPGAEQGWKSWNGQSPEASVCMFVGSLILMARPKLILETGVGQGYMTRAIVDVLDDGVLVAFESDRNWREALWSLPFWQTKRFLASLSEKPTPGLEEIARADLCVFDSDFEYRFPEVRMWHAWAKPGAVAIIHDTADQPDTIHQSMRDLINDLGMTGVFLNNPRGCFLAVQGREK